MSEPVPESDRRGAMKQTTLAYRIAALVLLGPLSAMAQTAGEIRGIPASDSLSAEDIWQNPTFVGGVVNGGPTAHSEW